MIFNFTRVACIACFMVSFCFYSESQADIFGLGFLPGGNSSDASDVNSDGSVVVGAGNGSNGREAFRWTSSGGMQGLGDIPLGSFFSIASGVSENGLVVVGSGRGLLGQEAFRWTSSGGMQGFRENLEGRVDFSSSSGLVFVTPDGVTAFGWSGSNNNDINNQTFRLRLNSVDQVLGYFTAQSASANGSVVVGRREGGNGREAVRWTNSGGVQGLGDLPGGDISSWATGVSGDGSTIVGRSEGINGTEAFRWTASNGMQGLGDLLGANFNSTALDASEDGSVIVGEGRGFRGTEAFIWETGTKRMLSLFDVLAAQGDDLSGWTSLTSARAVSADGRTIVGFGRNSSGNTEAFVATIEASTITHVPIYTFHGDSADDQFGFSVSGAGDVNGDGTPDLIIGASGDDNNGSNSGSVRVLSGSDGSVLYNFDGDSAEDYFGGSVSGAGDVNGDGRADLIVGAWGDDNNNSDISTNTGNACVLSGIDGSVLYNFSGDTLGDSFGRSVSGAGDVNGDGTPDLIVGADGDDNNGLDSGVARVLSGSDGSVLYNFEGDNGSVPFVHDGDQFGFSVSGAGDVNGDGTPDLIVGAQGDDNNGFSSGSARVLSGIDGSVLYNFDGDSSDDRFGRSVSGAGDVNGDGTPDLIVGAPEDDNNGQNSGSARVLSGIDGTILCDFNGDSADDQFGYSVSGVGDVNGDGMADLIVGAPFNNNNGSARVHSGFDGRVLYSFDGDNADDQFGFSVCGAGDINGDGIDDFIVGTPFGGANGGGYARVFVSQVTEPITGDFDGDGDVDGDDVDFYVGNLGQQATGNLAQLDLNGDGEVTIVDHNLHVTTLVVTFNGITGALLGDVDLDGVVDVLSDAFALVGSLGQSATSRSQGDLNADGVVDVLNDAFILVGQLGQSNEP